MRRLVIAVSVGAALLLVLASTFLMRTTPPDQGGLGGPVGSAPLESPLPSPGDAAGAPASAEPPPGVSPASGILPEFPWPPPPPSARLNLAPALFEDARTQFDVGVLLTGALQRADYSEYVFYRVPRGFALVARLERINADGTPAPEQLRFLSPDANEPFSIYEYVRRLFIAPEGLYRQIVFLVTNEPFAAGGQELTEQEAERMLRSGANRLPDEFRGIPFDGARAVTAFVYEFQKGGLDNEDVKILNPGRFQGRTHLERSGILVQLVALRQRR